MAGKVFINYRRDDERATAARIRDRLAQTFGVANVFMDVDNLMAGQRFDQELEKALLETDVFLAVIGPRWMELLAERAGQGERDYVREEIARALKRGITVIPLLIDGTQLPRADSLPEDIQELVLHQKHGVAHEQFGRDLSGLIKAIRFARQQQRKSSGGALPAVPWGWVVGTAAGVVLVGWIGAYQLGLPVWTPFPKTTEPRLVPSEADLDEAARRLVLKEQAKAKESAEVKRKADAEAARQEEERRNTFAEAAREAAAKAGRLTTLKADQERRRSEPVVVPAAPLNGELLSVVFDTSGSMWGKLEGSSEPKWQIARAALEKSLLQHFSGSTLGLIHFESSSSGGCGEVKATDLTADAAGIQGLMPLSGLYPKGKSPIASALRAAAARLSPTKRSSIILIHDDNDNCGIDVCQAAAEVSKSHPMTNIHALHLGTSAEDVERVKCVAALTGGVSVAVSSSADVEKGIDRLIALAARQGK